MYTFSLRLSDEIADKLKAIAEIERRSMNREVEYIIEQYIRKLEEEKQTA